MKLLCCGWSGRLHVCDPSHAYFTDPFWPMTIDSQCIFFGRYHNSKLVLFFLKANISWQNVKPGPPSTKAVHSTLNPYAGISCFFHVPDWVLIHGCMMKCSRMVLLSQLIYWISPLFRQWLPKPAHSSTFLTLRLSFAVNRLFMVIIVYWY